MIKRNKNIEKRAFKDDFFQSMIKYLNEIFPEGWSSYSEKLDQEFCEEDGTAGWYDALKQTCEDLNISGLIDYYDSLPWYLGDEFDGELGDALIEFKNKEN